MIEQMEQMTAEQGFPPEATADYKAMGGTPLLDFRHTVFGQVFSGMEVVDSIAAVKTGPQDKPVEPVTIDSITVEVLA